MTREELRDYVDEQRGLGSIPYHVYSTLIGGIDTLEQEPCKDAVSRQEVKERMVKYGFNAPDMTVTEFVEDLPPVNTQEPKYCDRNICLKNEYNGIGCAECEVTKSQERKELSEHEKFILSQMANSDVKTVEKIGLMYQKQLAEIYQQQSEWKHDHEILKAYSDGVNEVLDKIRAEIAEELLTHSGTGEEVIQAYADGLKKGLDVIGKYKVGSEV